MLCRREFPLDCPVVGQINVFGVEMQLQIVAVDKMSANKVGR